MMTFPIYGKIKFMFQTTKQFGRLQSQTHCAVKRWDACLSAPKDKASGCQLAIFHTMAASKIRRHIHMILAKGESRKQWRCHTKSWVSFYQQIWFSNVCITRLWSNSSLVRNIGFNGFDLSCKIWVGRERHTLPYLQEEYDTEVKLTCNDMQCDLCKTIMIQHENMPYLNKKLRRVNFQHLMGLVSLQLPGFTDPRFTQPFADSSCLHVISNG